MVRERGMRKQAKGAVAHVNSVSCELNFAASRRNVVNAWNAGCRHTRLRRGGRDAPPARGAAYLALGAVEGDLRQQPLGVLLEGGLDRRLRELRVAALAVVHEGDEGRLRLAEVGEAAVPTAVVPAAVPFAKEIIRALDVRDVAEDARKALTASSARDVHEIAASRLLGAGLLDHPDIGAWLRNAVEEASGFS